MGMKRSNLFLKVVAIRFNDLVSLFLYHLGDPLKFNDTGGHCTDKPDFVFYRPSSLERSPSIHQGFSGMSLCGQITRL